MIAANVLAFFVKNRKVIGVALAAGLLLAGIGGLVGAWQIEKGRRISLQAQLEAEQTRYEVVTGHLEQCAEANEGWVATGELWKARMAEMQQRLDRYRRELQGLSHRHATIEMERDELLTRIESIESEDCEGALDELVTALGWGAL